MCNSAKQQRNQTTDRMKIWAEWRKKCDEWQEQQQQYCYITQKSRTNKKKHLDGNRIKQTQTERGWMYGSVVCVSCMKSPEYEQKDVEKCLVLHYLHITMDAAWMWYLHLTATATQTHQTHAIWIIQTQFYFTCVGTVSFFFVKCFNIFSLFVLFMRIVFVVFALNLVEHFPSICSHELYEYKNHINSHSKWSWLEINDRL